VIAFVITGLACAAIVAGGLCQLDEYLVQLGGRRRGDQPSITCPRCGMTSYSRDDVREGYCGNCHDWTSHRFGGDGLLRGRW